jgi:hypothetical protein
MKTRLLLSMTLFIVAAYSLYAEDPVLPANANKALIEENLLMGLNSTNDGLRHGCALMLGNIKSTHAVIPLMALLKQSDNFKLRTAAAWALCKIGDPRGTFAVMRAVEFSDCCKTKLVCAWYFENMVKPGSFKFKEEDEIIVAKTKDPQ